RQAVERKLGGRQRQAESGHAHGSEQHRLQLPRRRGDGWRALHDVRMEPFGSPIQDPIGIIGLLVVEDKAEDVERVLGRWRARQGPLAGRLTAAIRDAIAAGDLWWGRRLPAERALAVALGLSRSTVVGAYDQLRSEGWLESRRGSGTFVSAAATAGAASHSSATTNAIFSRMIAPAGPVVDLSMASPADDQHVPQPARPAAQDLA